MKPVNEFKTAQRMRAWIVLSPSHEHVATVQAHYSDNPAGRVCTVSVWCKQVNTWQTSRAGGGGYDKLTAALEGMTIAGIRMEAHGLTRLERHGYTVIQAL